MSHLQSTLSLHSFLNSTTSVHGFHLLQTNVTTTPYGFVPGQNCFQSLELIFIVNLTSSRPTICSQLYLACVAWLFPEIIHSRATQIKLLGLLPVLELDQTLSCFGNCSKLTQKMAKSCWLLCSSIVTIDMFWAF